MKKFKVELMELINELEKSNYSNNNGELKKDRVFKELKERVEEMAVKPEEPKEITYIDRMRIEKNDLCPKINKLIEFQETETFKKLDDFQRYHLFVQCYFMQKYLEVLNTRISYEVELKDKKIK